MLAGYLPSRARSKRPLVHVRGKDVDVPLFPGKSKLMQKHHGDGVGLLARGARRGPNADGKVGVPGRDLPDRLQVQRLPCNPVAEEGGDADHEVGGEKGGL